MTINEIDQQLALNHYLDATYGNGNQELQTFFRKWRRELAQSRKAAQVEAVYTILKNLKQDNSSKGA